MLDKDGNRVLPTKEELQRTGGGKVQVDQEFPGLGPLPRAAVPKDTVEETKPFLGGNDGAGSQHFVGPFKESAHVLCLQQAQEQQQALQKERVTKHSDELFVTACDADHQRPKTFREN